MQSYIWLVKKGDNLYVVLATLQGYLVLGGSLDLDQVVDSGDEYLNSVGKAKGAVDLALGRDHLYRETCRQLAELN